MDNVVVAIGGSGTKVAEAIVRLLAIGFPTRQTRTDHGNVLTSAGDTLRIWRVDTDSGNGASHSLQDAVEAYNKLQEYLSAAASPRWGIDMSIDPQVRHLNPLNLPGVDTKTVKNLRGLLDSGAIGKESSRHILEAFFEPKELDVKIDRGFYQKPFIGSAAMAMFASSLAMPNSHGAQQVQLNTLSTGAPVRFFLCGSLHGGTGASGVPVLGRFLREQKSLSNSREWRIGACLLAPYLQPSEPPIPRKEIQHGQNEPGEDLVETLIEKYGNRPAFNNLTDGEKRDLVKQVLQGFYADPKEMEARFRQGLKYFCDHAAGYFDDIYMVGKLQPDILSQEKWSNGGRNQNNPLNSAEIIAALQALEFFSSESNAHPGVIKITRLGKNVMPARMHLRDLPNYEIGSMSIDAERVFLASALMRHFLVQIIPWDLPIDGWQGALEHLRKFYIENPRRKEEDPRAFPEIANLLSSFLSSLVSPLTTCGWEGTDAAQLNPFLSDDEAIYRSLQNKMKRSLLSPKPRRPVEFGSSEIRISIPQLGELWPFNGVSPDGQSFTRADYLRFIWTELMTRCQTQATTSKHE